MKMINLLSPLNFCRITSLALLLSTIFTNASFAQIGVDAKAPQDAEMLFDGTKKMLTEKWT